MILAIIIEHIVPLSWDASMVTIKMIDTMCPCGMAPQCSAFRLQVGEDNGVSSDFLPALVPGPKKLPTSRVMRKHMWDILPWWFNLLLVTWCLQHFLLLTRYTLWFYDVYGSILLWWYNLWLVMVYDITRWCMMFTMMLWQVIWCLEHSITLSHHYEWGYLPILTWLARC